MASPEELDPREDTTLEANKMMLDDGVLRARAALVRGRIVRASDIGLDDDEAAGVRHDTAAYGKNRIKDPRKMRRVLEPDGNMIGIGRTLPKGYRKSLVESHDMTSPNRQTLQKLSNDAQYSAKDEEAIVRAFLEKVPDEVKQRMADGIANALSKELERMVDEDAMIIVRLANGKEITVMLDMDAVDGVDLHSFVVPRGLSNIVQRKNFKLRRDIIIAVISGLVGPRLYQLQKFDGEGYGGVDEEGASDDETLEGISSLGELSGSMRCFVDVADSGRQARPRNKIPVKVQLIDA